VFGVILKITLCKKAGLVEEGESISYPLQKIGLLGINLESFVLNQKAKCASSPPQ